MGRQTFIGGLSVTGLACLLVWAAASASEVQLKDGTIFEGTTALLPSLMADAKGTSPGDPIIVIDDMLRRIYVPKIGT
jgi:hypothetical protein